MRTEDLVMHRKRFAREPYVIRLPQPPSPVLAPHAFVLCPLVLPPGQSLEQLLWRQWIYQRAFEQAQAVARPSLLERDLLAVWN
jgi:hypothetical protein